MVTKEELDELNDLFKDEMKDTKYARSRNAKFFIVNGKLQTHSKPSHNSDFKAHKSSPKLCPRCNGKGEYEYEIDDIQGCRLVKCEDCGGSGKAS